MIGRYFCVKIHIRIKVSCCWVQFLNHIFLLFVPNTLHFLWPKFPHFLLICIPTSWVSTVFFSRPVDLTNFSLHSACKWDCRVFFLVCPAYDTYHKLPQAYPVVENENHSIVNVYCGFLSFYPVMDSKVLSRLGSFRCLLVFGDWTQSLLHAKLAVYYWAVLCFSSCE